MRGSRTDWTLVWLLWAAGLAVAAQYGKLSVTFDRLPAIYPDAGLTLGIAVSLVGFVGIVLGVVAGVVVARIGYRRALLAALVAGAMMSAFQSTFPPMPWFLASRVVEGAAHVAVVVAAPTLIAQNSTARDSGRALTLWGTFFGVSFTILAWFGLPLVDSLGLAALLLVHAVYMVAVSVALWVLLPPSKPFSHAPGLKELILAHGRIYTSPRIGAPALGWLSYTLCYVGVLTVFPPFLPDSMRTIVLGAIPLLSILSSMTLGVLLLRFVEATSVVVIGFAICAAAALVLAVVPGSSVVALALGVGFGLVQGATFAAVPQLNERAGDRALANGGLAQIGNLGNTLGTPVLLVVVATFGYGGMTLALCLAFCAGAAIHLTLRAVRQI